MDVVDIFPVKKNPRGKFIGTDQKKIIINAYKDKLRQQLENLGMSKLSSTQMIVEISKITGIGQRTILHTLTEYSKSHNKKKVRPTVIDKVDEFDHNAIRLKIHNLWRNREVPTIEKVIVAINEDDSLPNLSRSNIKRILKKLQFEFVNKNRNSALLEREDLIIWRRSYIDKIRHYRTQNRPIYYLSETWVSTGETQNKARLGITVKSSPDAFINGLTTGQKQPSGKVKRIIVLHIGSKDGFVPGGFLCFESITNSSAYYQDEIDGDTFFKWFVKILPLLEENAVIVMDNASCHSVKKHKTPAMSWKKQAIIDWLESKGEIVNHPIVKVDLMKNVRKIKSQYDQYVIDEYARDNGKIVLRLPPDHCELNPIELAWSSVKSYVRMHNHTFKLKDVLQLLNHGVDDVTPKMWANFVGHVIKEEDKFWDIEHITDEVMDAQPEARHVRFIGTGDALSSSDYDSD